MSAANTIGLFIFSFRVLFEVRRLGGALLAATCRSDLKVATERESGAKVAAVQNVSFFVGHLFSEYSG
jgi:hypothetical protein